MFPEWTVKSQREIIMFYMRFINLLITLDTEMECGRISKYNHIYKSKSRFHYIIFVSYMYIFVNQHEINPIIHHF